MREVRECRNSSFAARRGGAPGTTLYRTAAEMLLYGWSVYVSFSDVHRIAGVVKKPPGNEHTHIIRLIAQGGTLAFSDGRYRGQGLAGYAGILKVWRAFQGIPSPSPAIHAAFKGFGK